ncbi:aldo/keto reductase [Lentzea sp. NPDC005914]|uniref:aldo/keto reductase n=1 Tax=Lentzea sp. NPDC005914 TaxID=3154572 RepID=UPI0033D64326
MGTDYVDVLLLHSPPLEMFDNTVRPYLTAATRMVEEGKVRTVGLSLGPSTADELALAVKTTGCQVVEVRFNAMYQAALPAFDLAAERGVGVVVKVPVESGWLTGKGVHGLFDRSRSRRWTDEDRTRRAEPADEVSSVLPGGVDLPTAALRFILGHEAV